MEIDIAALRERNERRAKAGLSLLPIPGQDAAVTAAVAKPIVRATLRDQRADESDEDYRARCNVDYDARVAAGTITPVHLPASAYAEPQKSRTFGMVFMSHNIKTCGRCGADPTVAGVVRNEFSWAHTCAIAEAACP